ncbi:MAG TPA: hypothetical protein DE315_06005 [Candidatus Omnitrophica bacterium]|nr:MAG: hypothetical protein A2Y05_02160 [Omnitrophica WOR_2 bacterium GWA2_53_43]HBO96989.1 hypothetical protein [Candidatus Omnitrophota bacterium]HCI45063.1 hypothetical protein [Candidatus Omnitrophota bacterium]
MMPIILLMVSCLLLSAGFSSRFGSPKALARLDGRTLIEHLQELLLSTQLHEIIIVLGHGAEGIKPFLFKHKKIKVVYNKDYKFGQTSSFKCGLKEVAAQATGILLLPVDYPAVKAETLDTLITFFEEKKPVALIPSYRDKKGHPPILNVGLKSELLALEDPVGVNTVIHHHRDDVTVLPVDDAGVLKSFNTKEEFDQLKAELT